MTDRELRGADRPLMPHAETKASDGPAAAPGIAELAATFSTFMRTFETFKQENDDRLSEIERRGNTDPLAEDKVDRINDTLDAQARQIEEMKLAMSRPALDAGRMSVGSIEAKAHGLAWGQYMRRGEVRGLQGFEAKALSAGSDPDGGYLVPSETERMIERVVADISPIRAIASVRQISSGTYKKPFTTEGPEAGWVGESEARPQKDGPSLAELEFPAMELYAMPAATGTLLDDAAINLDEWLAEEVQVAFAEQEGKAFVDGDGVKKPRGFLDYDKVADANWSWSKLGYLVSGADGAFATSQPSDVLVDLVYALKAGYRANGRFVMNRSTQAKIRKFKDLEGNYLWQPGLAAGAPPTLLNFPVSEAEDMPDIGEDAFAIAFGDFRRGYLVVDRLGVRVLRDPYSAKPYVLFYTTKRVGGGVQNFEAIKLLKFAQS